MSADELKVDYPEHLNPFHHRRNTLARSFRGIKKAIVRSFTGKDKDKPTIRPKQETSAFRNVMSMPPDYTEPPILFPRSRFSERLTKTDAMRIANRTNTSSLDRLENNPFEGRDKSELKSNINGDNVAGVSPIPAERKSRRRKKKAPIPPGSMTGSVNESKWSLVSTDSEMSSICYSESEIDYVLNNNVNEKNEEILKITREIVKFTEDTNNNSISHQTPNEDKHFDDAQIHNNNIEEKCDDNAKSTNHQEDKDKDDIHVEEVREDSKIANNTNCESLNDKIPSCKCNANDSNNKCNHCTALSDVEASPNDSGFIEDDRKLSRDNSNNSSREALEILDPNRAAQSNINEKQDKQEEEQEENERGEEIGQGEKEALPLEVINKTETDSSESRLSVKGTIDFFEGTCASPSPKIRKNILTKEKLLGAE